MSLKKALKSQRDTMSSLWIADFVNELKTIARRYPDDAALGREIRKEINEL